ncbi:MAG TPA: hypothetical protein VGB15_22465 [Longimicrobium sp.]|jgi:hypothetical protein
MKNPARWILLAAALAGCSDQVPTATPSARDAAGGPARSLSYTDADQDGIDDGREADLIDQYAPLLYMPNLIERAQAGSVTGDWTWPANVQWYFPQVRMRMHHNSCPDHAVLDFGYVNTGSLISQQHRRFTLGWSGCSHQDPVQYSSGSWHPDDHFFLQAGTDDQVHPGIHSGAAGWIVYAHAYRNNIGGVSIQYWFFYPYNDYVSSANHEGDWEHVNVRLDAADQVNTVWYSQHDNLVAYAPWQLTWYGTHPQVWVADGSHANYPSQATCDSQDMGPPNCWTNVSQRWFTWAGGRGYDAGLQGGGIVNVGERFSPMAGQEWIRYSGRWGEVGNVDGTSGPRGPVYNKHNWWYTDQYVPPAPEPTDPPECEPTGPGQAIPDIC